MHSAPTVVQSSSLALRFLLRRASQENVAQHAGVKLVIGGIDQRNAALPRKVAQLVQQIGVLSQLLCIAITESLPSGRSMSEPFS